MRNKNKSFAIKMKELEIKREDKIEIVKQQQKKQTLVLQKRIIPHENHIIFEYNQVKDILIVAEYEPVRTEIHWFEAIRIFKKKVDKVDIFNPNPIQKTKVIQKPNCIYLSALNIDNAVKVLRRDYNINYKQK